MDYVETSKRAGAICLLVGLTAGAAPAQSLPAGIRVQRDVAYGPSGAQKMDIYLPAHPQHAPILLMVHGGAWTMGDKSSRQVVANKATHWLPKGYIFISINNRLLPSAGPYEQAEDVARALAFTETNGAMWGGDPQRIVLIGHSAGAHLVSLLTANPEIAYAQGAKRWLGTISLDSAAMDIVTTMKARHYRFYDTAFGTDPTYWEKTSPLLQLKEASLPMLLVCSTRRPDHPCEQARKFVAKDTSLGGKATVLPEDLTHREINETLGLQGSYTESVDEFLRSLGLP